MDGVQKSGWAKSVFSHHSTSPAPSLWFMGRNQSPEKDMEINQDPQGQGN